MILEIRVLYLYACALYVCVCERLYISLESRKILFQGSLGYFQNIKRFELLRKF